MPGPLYPESLAARYRGSGKKYRPSNGTEGMMFADLWCEQCVKDALWRQSGDGSLGCTVRTASFVYDYDDERYPPEWIHDDQGQPCCTAFQREDA